MGVILRIALAFFLIQFLVVLTIMVVALLVARPDVPLLGRETGTAAILRSLAFVGGLPRRTYGSAARLAHLVTSKLSTPIYRF